MADTPPMPVAADATKHRYNAVVLDVHDGDTVKLSVDLNQRMRGKDRDLGFHIYREGGRLRLHESFRLYGLNAPELATGEGRDSRAHLVEMLTAEDGDGWAPLVVQTQVVAAQDAKEKYGRWLGTLWLPGRDLSVNASLVLNGWAKPWDGKGERPV